MEKLFNACEKKNCASVSKRNKTLKKKYQKMEKEKCSSNEDFYNCSTKIYTNSGHEKSFKELTDCNDTYCKKEKEERANAYTAEFDYLPTPSFMKKGGGAREQERERVTRERGIRKRGTRKLFTPLDIYQRRK